MLFTEPMLREIDKEVQGMILALGEQSQMNPSGFLVVCFSQIVEFQVSEKPVSKEGRKERKEGGMKGREKGRKEKRKEWRKCNSQCLRIGI